MAIDHVIGATGCNWWHAPHVMVIKFFPIFLRHSEIFKILLTNFYDFALKCFSLLCTHKVQRTYRNGKITQRNDLH